MASSLNPIDLYDKTSSYVASGVGKAAFIIPYVKEETVTAIAKFILDHAPFVATFLYFRRSIGLTFTVVVLTMAAFSENKTILKVFLAAAVAFAFVGGVRLLRGKESIGRFLIKGAFATAAHMIAFAANRVTTERGRGLSQDIDELLPSEEEEVDVQKIFSDSLLGNVENLFQINSEDVRIEEVLGAGNDQSSVYKSTWNSHQVAYKCFKLRDIVGRTSSDSSSEENQKRCRAFELELNLFASLNHPNVIRFFGAGLSPHRVGFLMELCSNGEVKEFLQGNPDYEMSKRVRMIQEIASAMVFLHQKNMILGELGCHKVLVTDDEETRLKVWRFSQFHAATQSKNSETKTLYYQAPEITLGNPETSKVDVYSFAIMMFEILTGKFDPYKKEDKKNENVAVKAATDQTFRPDITLLPENCRELFSELIRSSWDNDPEKRPSFEEILDSLPERNLI
ncbi:MAG: Serine/threonine-protein kinase PrkC [Chlamydiae bacterium]|nr:Serine/threonine-protein kinase PrkC [Chlamydiota bacterium]